MKKLQLAILIVADFDESHHQMLQDRSTISIDHDLELITKLTNENPVVNKGSQDNVILK